ncbi:MAG: gliding motility-associated C-terminal domain-containing protein, partial [Bacteroidia bacterium]|nr:gliding motility-associated C-terminal domain-containing protein [Bacteroidia bacterium]
PVNNLFAWLLNGDTIRSEFKKFGNSDTLPMVFPTKETDYIISVDNGCPAFDTVTVRVLEIPEINELDGKVCRGDSVQLDATAEGAISYSWTPTVGLSDPTIANPMCTPTNSTEYIVVVTYDTLCPPASDTVNVRMNSAAVDAGEDEEIFKGDQVQLNATGAVKYSWYPEYGLSDTSIANPIANPDSTTTYILFGKDGFDCLVMDTLIVVVVPFEFEPAVPDAFTPDQNGLNDKFYVYDILGEDGDALQALETFDLKIFNRWGEIIYVGTDITEGWNGRHYKTGKEMEVGVYIWLLTATTIKGVRYGPMSGNVSLIR